MGPVEWSTANDTRSSADPHPPSSPILAPTPTLCTHPLLFPLVQAVFAVIILGARDHVGKAFTHDVEVIRIMASIAPMAALFQVHALGWGTRAAYACARLGGRACSVRLAVVGHLLVCACARFALGCLYLLLSHVAPC